MESHEKSSCIETNVDEIPENKVEENTSNVPNPAKNKDDVGNSETEEHCSAKVEAVAEDNVISLSYCVYDDICSITGAWSDFNSRTECFTKGCKWAPDGTCIVTNSADNILRIYDLPPELHCQETWDTGQSLEELKPALAIPAGQQVYDYNWYPLMSSWNPLSCCLVSTSKDNPVHLWDAFTGELRCTYRCYNQVDEIETAHCVSFDYTGEKLYCGLNNGIRVFNTSIPGRDCEVRNLKGQCYGTVKQIGIISSIAVNPSMNDIYAAGSYLKTVGLYTEPRGELLCLLTGHKGGITHIAFSPDGTKLLSGGRKDPEIICWDIRNPGVVLYVLQREVNTNQRIYFDITPDGCYAISGASSGKVTIWDLQQPPVPMPLGPILQPIKLFQAHEDCVNGVSIHQQYPVLATSSGQRHFQDLCGDSSSDSENFSDENDSECNIIKQKIRYENSLKLWWLGPKKSLILP